MKVTFHEEVAYKKGEGRKLQLFTNDYPRRTVDSDQKLTCIVKLCIDC